MNIPSVLKIKTNTIVITPCQAAGKYYIMINFGASNLVLIYDQQDALSAGVFKTSS